MPTYDYRCAKCGEDLEVFQSFSETPLTKHAGCGGKLTKVMSPAGIVLKGSGFYKTDNRESKKRSASKESTSSKDTGGGSGTDSTSSTNGKGSSEGSGSNGGDSKKSDTGSGSGGSTSSSDTKKPTAKSA